jgi:hypothetical protein
MEAMSLGRFARVLVLISAATPLLALSGWGTPGPPGTRATAVGAAGDDDSRAYAAATTLESGTSVLYRTDDAGLTWTPLIEASGADSYAEVFPDPRDGNRVFASAQKGNGLTDVYRSLDRGGNWSTVLTISTRCVPSFAAAGGPDALVLTCGTRVFRTSDAGLSWDEPAAPFTAATRLAPGPAGTLYAYELTRVFRSTNGATTWTEVGQAPAACPGLLALDADPSAPGTLLAGVGLLGTGGFQCGGVFRSTDSGASWAVSSIASVYVTDVAFAPSGGRVYACASSIPGLLPPGGVYVSGDGGRTFGGTGLPSAGALEIAVSASGAAVYAATPLGVFARDVRATRRLPQR